MAIPLSSVLWNCIWNIVYMVLFSKIQVLTSTFSLRNIKHHSTVVLVWLLRARLTQLLPEFDTCLRHVTWSCGTQVIPMGFHMKST